MGKENEKDCLFEIRSGMYGEPLMTKGTYSSEGARTVYKCHWKKKKRESSHWQINR